MHYIQQDRYTRHEVTASRAGSPSGRTRGQKGHSLPCRIFSNDQRVNHTAVVENKRLGHALAQINAQQGTKYAPKVKTNSEIFTLNSRCNEPRPN